MEESEIDEFVEDGWIQAIVIFEVVGNPKRHIVNSLDDYMENIASESDVKVLEKEREPPEEVEDGVYSTLCEAEMLIHGLERLNWICFNFSPASVEIMRPVNFTFHSSELQNWVNDFIAKLHEVGQVSKQVRSQNKVLSRNMGRLIKNGILVCIDSGYDTPKEIEERLGIDYERLKPFFEALIEEDKLSLHEDTYKRTDE